MRIRIFVATLCILASTAAVFGKNPPRLHGKSPVAKPGDPAEDFTPAYPTPGAMAPADRDPHSVSGIMLPPPFPVHETASISVMTTASRMLASNGQEPAATAPAVYTRPRFGVLPLDVPSWINSLYSWNMTNQAGADVEPANIALTLSGTTYHTSTCAHWNGSGYDFLAKSTSNLNSGSSGPITTNTLYLPAGYSDAGDAWLAENPYTTGYGPGRIYTSGILFNRDANGNGISPSQVRLYYTLDGGLTWTGGTAVDYRTNSTDPLLDKPAMDVSWYGPTLGYILVAYVEAGNPQRVILRWNTDGLWTRCRPAGGGCLPINWHETTITNLNVPEGPQVVVNSTNGDVYVLWATQSASPDIRMRRATDNMNDPTNLTFGPEIVVANNYTNVWNLSNGMRSPTVAFQARFNPATPAGNSLAVTWNASDFGSQGTALYYTSFDGSAIQQGDPVPARQRFDAAGEQFQGVVDNDDTGNLLLSYYSTQNDGALQRYQLMGMYLTPSGGTLIGPSVLNSTLNNNTYDFIPYRPVFIGDYHDIFYWAMGDVNGTRWDTSWTRFVNPSGDQDTWITGVR